MCSHLFVNIVWGRVRFGRPLDDGNCQPRDKKESSKVGRQRFNPSHKHVKHKVPSEPRTRKTRLKFSRREQPNASAPQFLHASTSWRKTKFIVGYRTCRGHHGPVLSLAKPTSAGAVTSTITDCTFAHHSFGIRALGDATSFLELRASLLLFDFCLCLVRSRRVSGR